MAVLRYKPGTILMLEAGEYSDFGYVGGFVTLCELDLTDAITAYKEQYKPKNDWDEPDQTGFVAWLVTTQQCAPLEYQTAHIGSYGELTVDEN